MGIIDTTEDTAIHKLIAVRAYELWESHGRPHGCDLINWHQAEQEIMSCIDHDRSLPANRPTVSRSAIVGPKANRGRTLAA